MTDQFHSKVSTENVFREYFIALTENYVYTSFEICVCIAFTKGKVAISLNLKRFGILQEMNV